MTHPLFKSLRLDGFLSFAPGSSPVELRALNVLIGPNGSGKSNFIEAFELLQATTTGLQSFLRTGGVAEDWIWKGKPTCSKATLAVELQCELHPRELYQLGLVHSGARIDVDDELFRELAANEDSDVPLTFVEIGGRTAKIATKSIGPNGPSPTYEVSPIDRQYLKSEEPVFLQRQDERAFPDLYRLRQTLGGIYTFREWSFGRYAQQRKAQSTALPNDELIPDGSNLALFLTDLEHVDYQAYRLLSDFIGRFLPRFERLSTRIIGGTTQLYFHEAGTQAPIPAQRLSDGTLRFVAMLATLLAPGTPSLICIDEPELGLHPDAMTLMAELLVEVSQRTQIVVTTHSESLLSRLSEHSDSVLVCEHTGNATNLERLDAERLSFWLEKYTLGEIWRVGKLGGNP